jgi:hypothetical protein
VNRRRTVTALAVGAVLLAGCGGQSDTPPAAATSTATASVPKACLDALDAADTALAWAREGLANIQENLRTASEGNFSDAGPTGAANVAALRVQDQTLLWAEARDACRAAVGR